MGPLVRKDIHVSAASPTSRPRSGDIDLQGLAEVEISHLGDDRGAETSPAGRRTHRRGGWISLRRDRLAWVVGSKTRMASTSSQLLDPNRVRLARRPQVDEAATDGHLADAGYLGRWIVAGGRRPRSARAVDAIVAGPAAGTDEVVPRRRSLPECGDRRDDHQITLGTREAESTVRRAADSSRSGSARSSGSAPRSGRTATVSPSSQAPRSSAMRWACSSVSTTTTMAASAGRPAAELPRAQRARRQARGARPAWVAALRAG